ncbi:MAG: hypothetical protein U0176_07935 [Bacteroidia bacterium]
MNDELRDRFPNNSSQLNKLPVDSGETVIYAYLHKQFVYGVPFDRGEIYFDHKRVAGFGAADVRQRGNVRILHYENDNRFLLRVVVESPIDELFLAKGFSMDDPSEALAEVRYHAKAWGDPMNEDDQFAAPVLNLDFERDYLNGDPLNFTAGGQPWMLEFMKERVRFKMDEKGVKLENEAILRDPKGGIKMKPKPKILHLDKPYWVVMKLKKSDRPYFLLGVRNTAMMTRK